LEFKLISHGITHACEKMIKLHGGYPKKK